MTRLYLFVFVIFSFLISSILSETSSNVYIIGVAGGSGSGKTYLAKNIVELASECGEVSLLQQDMFYTPVPDDVNKTTYNFDLPEAFDHDLFFQVVSDLKHGLVASHPVYDFTTSSRTSEMRTVGPADVVVIEGLFTLYDARVRELIDFAVFVEADDDVRLSRRLRRDAAERGRDVGGILDRYENFVKPAHDTHVVSTKQYADVVVPSGDEKTAAMKALSSLAISELRLRGPCKEDPHLVEVDLAGF
eukprot:TRINITY_DN5067_c0_g1_i1.p1 TRINITY_DN5067_c0_g1~~TRINITY_DN5067_c0_g1_i1.p1  ORF type:complete len:247 (+),score=23.16 TRINITY_DN5067_c0_g1_i1:27-767(+)